MSTKPERKNFSFVKIVKNAHLMPTLRRGVEHLMWSETRGHLHAYIWSGDFAYMCLSIIRERERERAETGTRMIPPTFLFCLCPEWREITVISLGIVATFLF